MYERCWAESGEALGLHPGTLITSCAGLLQRVGDEGSSRCGVQGPTAARSVGEGCILSAVGCSCCRWESSPAMLAARNGTFGRHHRTLSSDNGDTSGRVDLGPGPAESMRPPRERGKCALPPVSRSLPHGDSRRWWISTSAGHPSVHPSIRPSVHPATKTGSKTSDDTPSAGRQHHRPLSTTLSSVVQMRINTGPTKHPLVTSRQTIRALVDGLAHKEAPITAWLMAVATAAPAATAATVATAARPVQPPFTHTSG
ncbi:uncharacterized protein BJ171DRAFT_182923 [Polychytrium aggregatum]|uniref:uncharacterized protein n=1 Tax=Polychytrium aggregatum TaxID=110093 RepID=UPI0022FED9DD|nr:uncharacterized protein BJ171DRAFT_182923 [Polychytrium aggregatum]KAI9202305.1 hypothetical protein BJ171DRAFT_182923 [Polychytrium aggregatum]